MKPTHIPGAAATIVARVLRNRAMQEAHLPESNLYLAAIDVVDGALEHSPGMSVVSTGKLHVLRAAIKFFERKEM